MADRGSFIPAMCATKAEPLSPPVEQQQLGTAFLHRKERKARKSKPVSLQLAWLFSHCSQTAGTGDGLFSALPLDHSAPPRDIQSYTLWKAMFDLQKLTHPRRMRRNTLILQPLSYTSGDYANANIEPQVMQHLQRFCQAFFHGNQVLLADPLDISTARKLTRRVHKDTGREQILVDDVMKFLKAQKYPKAYCVVGVTIVDLYPGEQWNFTLGHAAFLDGVAICSFGRYFNSRDIASPSSLHRQMQNMWILVRVLTHEICHLFGLNHCFYFNCAMNESSSILQAAFQPLFLCPICLRKLHKVLKFSLKERYLHLAQLCDNLNQLLSSSATSSSPDGPSSELDGVPEKQSSQAAAAAAAAAAVENVVRNSAEEHGKPTTIQLDEELLESPSVHFRQASEWLQTSIASLDRFVEQVGADSSVDSLRYEFLELHQ